MFDRRIRLVGWQAYLVVGDHSGDHYGDQNHDELVDNGDFGELFE